MNSLTEHRIVRVCACVDLSYLFGFETFRPIGHREQRQVLKKNKYDVCPIIFFLQTGTRVQRRKYNVPVNCNVSVCTFLIPIRI